MEQADWETWSRQTGRHGAGRLGDMEQADRETWSRQTERHGAGRQGDRQTGRQADG
jgi:hypothetical protein